MDTMTGSPWRIEQYSPDRATQWNEFVAGSRNATFLHDRRYMDYHQDRFTDCSWMAFKGDRLIALLPANLTADGRLHSHQGLTYGGWLLPPAHLDGGDLLHIFETAAGIWREHGIRSLDYKPVPFIYSAQPSQEDEYALFRLGAVRSECNLSSAINLKLPLGLNKLQKRHLAAARKAGFEIEEVSSALEFMSLVAQCLAERHDARPVHTAEEIELLRNRFPEQIRMFGLRREGTLHAGVMIFDTGTVAHAQYIATTPAAREGNMLTPLFHWLITERYAERNYFDLGTSNEDSGRYLNEGLLRQKFSYGATGVAYNRYRLDLT